MVFFSGLFTYGDEGDFEHYEKEKGGR